MHEGLGLFQNSSLTQAVAGEILPKYFEKSISHCGLGYCSMQAVNHTHLGAGVSKTASSPLSPQLHMTKAGQSIDIPSSFYLSILVGMYSLIHLHRDGLMMRE